MQRHPVLKPLSRAHHEALILAQLLKKDCPAYRGLPTDAEGKKAYALELFSQKLSQHFEQEEILLARISGRYPDIDRLAADIIREHRELRVAFHELKNSRDPVGDNDRLGRKLELHIRKEERQLFPKIEERLTVAEWEEIAPLIE